jgi:hypothetical protein
MAILPRWEGGRRTTFRQDWSRSQEYPSELVIPVWMPRPHSTRMSQLVVPGGTLAIVGEARSRLPARSGPGR